MEITGCPACGTKEIRLVRCLSVTEVRAVVAFRSGDERPVFVVDPEVAEEERDLVEEVVVCVNGHAHPDRVGFDLEWAGAADPGVS